MRPTTISILAELGSIRLDLSGVDNLVRQTLDDSTANEPSEYQASEIASRIHGVVDKLNALARYAEGRE